MSKVMLLVSLVAVSCVISNLTSVLMCHTNICLCAQDDDRPTDECTELMGDSVHGGGYGSSGRVVGCGGVGARGLLAPLLYISLLGNL